MQKKSFQRRRATCFANWLWQGKACAILEKRSVTTKTSMTFPEVCSALQKSIQMSSIGSEVRICSRGSRASGSGVFTTTRLCQFFTYNLMSFFIPGQKNLSAERKRVLALPWCPAASWTPQRISCFRESCTTYWRSFLFISWSLFTLYSTWLRILSFFQCFKR